MKTVFGKRLIYISVDILYVGNMNVFLFLYCV